MKVKKSLRNVINCKDHLQKKKDRNPLRHKAAALGACVALATGVLAAGGKMADSGEKGQVYAASEGEKAVSDFHEDLNGMVDYDLPTGIAGMVTSVEDTPSAGTSVTRIGTSCERVMVGQRVKRVKGNAAELSVGSSMANTVDTLDTAAIAMAANPKMMSDTDYDNLLRIVEAEAGTEDIKGRVLVANVILNRLKNDEFPDTITDVIWDQRYGVPQFSPTYDGKIYEVTVTDDTREAVKQALEGVDYSEGALFFIQRAAAEKHNVTWFDKDLKKLFKYGVHEFYTYPEEGEKTESTQTLQDEDVVQMVKK